MRASASILRISPIIHCNRSLKFTQNDFKVCYLGFMRAHAGAINSKPAKTLKKNRALASHRRSYSVLLFNLLLTCHSALGVS